MIAPEKETNISNIAINSEEIREVLERVLGSKYFANAPMKQRFLRLICEFHLNNHGRELNEYLIGREVFGRDDSYNPATDAVVRVGAHGIREKLDLYYKNEGVNDLVRIEIPVGAYEPFFVRNYTGHKHDTGIPATFEPLPLPPPLPVVTEPSRVRKPEIISHQKFLWLLYTTVIALAATVIVLIISNRNLQSRVDEKDSTVQRIRNSYGFVWAPFLHNNNPTLVTLSNPIVYRASNHADPEELIKKGVKLSAEEVLTLKNAGGFRLPLRNNGNAQLVPAFNMYTGIGEAIGGFQISSMLREVGETIQLKQSRSITSDDLKNYDLVLLGSVYANQWSKPLSVKENFVYSDKTTIVNLDPRNREQTEYKASFNPLTGELIEDHALISVTPGVSKDKSIMVLAGIYSEGTQAAVEFVTNINYINELNRKLRELGADKKAPMYFQAILRVGIENSFPTKIDLVTVRELKAQ